MKVVSESYTLWKVVLLPGGEMEAMPTSGAEMVRGYDYYLREV